MRKHAITEYESVLELLGKQSGCPVCAFLKNEQASLLQKGSDLSDGLCNAHAWGFAAVGDTDVAATALLRSLERIDPVGRRLENCWLCIRLRVVEDRAISDLLSSKGRATLNLFLEGGGSFCAPHAAKLRKSSDPEEANLIEKSDSRKRSELIMTLKALTSHERAGAAEQAGALGRAAEYLVSQRGLPPQESTTPVHRSRQKQAKSL